MRRRRLKSAIFLASAVAIVALACVGARRAKPDAVIDFFDVGQGDAALVSVGRSQLLVDGGPDATVLAKLGGAVPFTDRTIEAIVLTHPHADHYVGLISVLDRYRVNEVLLGEGVNDTPEYEAFMEAVRRSGARVVRVAAGDRIFLGKDAAVAVLWPPRADDGALDDKDPNSWSVVLRVNVAGRHALLMGDAPATVEERLLRSGAGVAADVLKVGHHGSRYSSSSPFLRAVSAKDAVVSVGKNSYGHPAWSAVERLKASGARVRQTDRDGDVRARFSGGDVVVTASGK